MPLEGDGSEIRLFGVFLYLAPWYIRAEALHDHARCVFDIRNDRQAG